MLIINLVARHFEFIFPLICLHCLFSSLSDFAGNLLKTNTEKKENRQFIFSREAMVVEKLHCDFKTNLLKNLI